MRLPQDETLSNAISVYDYINRAERLQLQHITYLSLPQLMSNVPNRNTQINLNC